MRLLKKIFFILPVMLLFGCNDGMAIISYNGNINEVESMYENKDGILVITNPEEEMMKDFSEQIKDDKYKDFEIKVMDINDAKEKPDNILGVINVIKNGEIIGHFKFDENNKIESLLNHALKIYKSESYTLNDSKFKALDNIIDLTNIKIESNEESKNFFDFQSNDKNSKNCKSPGEMANIESFNISNVDCLYESDDQHNIGMYNTSLYSEADFMNNLFINNNIKDSKYIINADVEDLTLYPLSFMIKNEDGKTLLSGEKTNDMSIYDFMNEDNKRFAYINNHNFGMSLYYYVFDKLDNKVYKSEKPIYENNGLIYFMNKNHVAAYDGETNKAYSLLNYKMDDKFNHLRSTYFAQINNDLFLMPIEDWQEKRLLVKLNTNKMENLEVNWSSNLLSN